MKTIGIAGLLLLATACSATATPTFTPNPPQPTTGTSGGPSPSPADGVEALVANLTAAGATASVGAGFLADPLPGEGVAVCVGKESVQVYLLKDHEAALAAAAMIDRNDPSHVGTAMVDWVGRPRFWLRDNMLVLYTGGDAATDAALRGVLGQPFAEARGPGRPPLPGPVCA